MQTSTPVVMHVMVSISIRTLVLTLASMLMSIAIRTGLAISSLHRNDPSLTSRDPSARRPRRWAGSRLAPGRRAAQPIKADTPNLPTNIIPTKIA